jgi:hypothetical protein
MPQQIEEEEDPMIEIQRGIDNLLYAEEEAAAKPTPISAG